MYASRAVVPSASRSTLVRASMSLTARWMPKRRRTSSVGSVPPAFLQGAGELVLPGPSHPRAVGLERTVLRAELGAEDVDPPGVPCAGLRVLGPVLPPAEIEFQLLCAPAAPWLSAALMTEDR